MSLYQVSNTARIGKKKEVWYQKMTVEKGRLYSKNDNGILSCFLGQAFLKQINLHDKRMPPFSLIAINWKRNSALCNSPGFSHSKVNEHFFFFDPQVNEHLQQRK